MISAGALWRHPEFRRGARDMVGVSPGIAAWGLVTGMAMVQGGLSPALAVAMSFLVYAGSAQLASLPLLAAGAPMGVIWAAAFCVNLRFVIYSTQWRSVFGHLPRARRLALGFLAADLNLIMFQRAHPEPLRAGDDPAGRIAYYLGGVAVLWSMWQVPSMFGIAMAHVIPTHWGLGFAGTLAMVGLTLGLINDRITAVAAIVAGTAAVASFALPLKLNIVVAIAAAVAVGLVMNQADKAAERIRSSTT
jgi:predicted branched-subunit amino acid permease